MKIKFFKLGTFAGCGVGLLLAGMALGGCSEDSAGASGTAGAGGGAESPLYLVQNVVFGAEGQTTYVSLESSIEEVDHIDSSVAIEFPGWADAWVFGDAVYVASGEAPEITRYSATTEHGERELVADGKPISFANFGADSVAFAYQLFVSETKAYFFNTPQREVVVWNPRELVVEKTFELPALPDRDGGLMLTGPTADRSSRVRDDRAFVPFYWANWTEGSMSEDSVILTIDTENDRVVAETSVDCPEVNFVTVDDEGTMYFSNWGYSVIPTLLAGSSPACAIRIHADEDVPDPDYRLRFSELTGGREGANLRYVGDGKALLTVLHDERIDLATIEDPYALTDGANWKLWLVDLGESTATEIDGLGFHAAGLVGQNIDGTYYLSLPSADYSSSSTYVIDSNGEASHRFVSTGWLTRLFRVR